MWIYEKRLEYPVKIKTPNPQAAKIIVSQLGGPDGELGAATRYLQQRYSMPYAQLKGMLTDIGTEEAAPALIKECAAARRLSGLHLCNFHKIFFIFTAYSSNLLQFS